MTAKQCLITSAAVYERTGKRRETIRKLVKAGIFPAPIRETEHGPKFYIEAEVDQWIADRISAARDKAAA